MTNSGVSADDAEVQAHADGDQEYADEQALERLDGDLDLTAILGAGQKQPADQGAERHRKAGGGGGESGRDHDQQAGGDEQFRAAGAGHASEQRAQHQAAERADQDDGERGPTDGKAELLPESPYGRPGRARRSRTELAPRRGPGTAGWRSWRALTGY